MIALPIIGLTVFHLPHHAWLISGGVLFFVTLLVLIHIQFIRVTKRRQDREKQMLVHESLRLHLFELQAQMRPHFIFNAVNSIQSYILNQDIDRSLHYLSLFSKLIRKMLENAERELIPVSEELEAVQHFLEIERMRFDGLFDYEIIFPPHFEIDTRQIPPLMLQPFIDMAILHGIRLRDSGGVLQLKVDHPANHLLTITIADNGPGWQHNLRQTTTTKEPGVMTLNLLRDRLALLNKLNNTDAFKADIEDLFDAEGKCTGTAVKLRYLLKEA